MADPLLTAADVATVTFPSTRFREGYDIADVTQLLALVSDTLAGYERPRGQLTSRPRGGMLAGEVVAARFTPTKFRAGWDQDAVDTYLDRIVATLRAHERSQ
ncbi:hypothetical protein BH11ACT3_BH11ACT3_13700 [soil metagenome]